MSLWLILLELDAEPSGGEREADDGLGVLYLAGGDQRERRREGQAHDLYYLVGLVANRRLAQARREEDPELLRAEAPARPHTPASAHDALAALAAEVRPVQDFRIPFTLEDAAVGGVVVSGDTQEGAWRRTP